jgi:hypothetical protein
VHHNAKFLVRIRELGYCCPWEFFRQVQGMPLEAQANYLGVRTRTLRFWRARATGCESNKSCHADYY